MKLRLPAEWETQDGVLLAWPHERTDWLPVLDRAELVFLEIAGTVSRFEEVVIVAPDPEAVRPKLAAAGVDTSRVRLYQVPTNDTWARDFGPITVERDSSPELLDFGFNGWGLKFPADQDNRVSRRLLAAGAFGKIPFRTSGLILEGGSIESDGRGTLLTTAQCLESPNRNPHLGRAQIEAELARLFGSEHFLWLHSGHLAGDDTDSHIDTLARLAPGDTILHVACPDESDEHFRPLARMTDELRRFRTREGRPFRLLPLPWPQPHFDAGGKRLPATYANFLVINNAVLVPRYQDPHDETALEVIGHAFPDRAIIGIDCSPLIGQGGSLHCLTMQLPKGVLT